MAAITLNEISREDMLRYAHGLVRGQRTWRHTPLWSFVRNVCGVGSTSGAAICRELGWNPDAWTSQELPPRRPPAATDFAPRSDEP